MGKGSSKHAEDTGENPATFDPVLLESLPQDLKDKFKSAYSNFKEQFEELESQYDRYRVDSGECKNRAMFCYPDQQVLKCERFCGVYNGIL